MCGEKLTQPEFFNGKPYGFSCIKKVNPFAKKSKEKSNWQPCIFLYIESTKIVVSFLGKRYSDSIYPKGEDYVYGTGIKKIYNQYYINIENYNRAKRDFLNTSI